MGVLKATVIPATAAFAALFLVLPNSAPDTTVRITGEAGAWRYEPAEVRIEPGQRVLFVNETGVTHTADCAGCPWRSGDIQPGEEVFVPLSQAGGFTFRCRYHPQVLVGVLGVGEDPPAVPEAEPAIPIEG